MRRASGCRSRSLFEDLAAGHEPLFSKCWMAAPARLLARQHQGLPAILTGAQSTGSCPQGRKKSRGVLIAAGPRPAFRQGVEKDAVEDRPAKAFDKPK